MQALKNAITANTVTKVVAGTCLAGSVAVFVKFLASRSERKPDFTVEAAYPEFASLARIEMLRAAASMQAAASSAFGSSIFAPGFGLEP
eukprot:2760053-Rhodomonas_salina.1